MDLICLILTLAYWALIVWVVLSWVVGAGRLPWGHPVTKIYESINRVLQPVLRPLRSALPPIRFGGVALDLSPLFLIIGLIILRSIAC